MVPLRYVLILENVLHVSELVFNILVKKLNFKFLAAPLLPNNFFKKIELLTAPEQYGK